MATLVAGEFNRQRTEKDGSREEERRRADEFHKDLLRRLHQSYSNFKRTKRLLRAEAFTLPYYGTSNEEARVNLERYDQHLQVLNDIQLDLENMAKDAEANRTDFAHSQEIAAAIRPMEERLDKVILNTRSRGGTTPRMIHPRFRTCPC
jgi:Mg2+ and Co2+ transporter CorA